MRTGLACGMLAIAASGCISLQVDTIPARDSWPSSRAQLGRWNSDSSSFSPPLTEQWTYNAGAGFGPGPPLVFEDFIIVATRKGEVHAIDRHTGAKLGKEELGSAINGTPVLRNGRLAVPIDYGSKRVLHVWNLDNGSSDWKLTGGATIATSPTIVGDNLIVVDRLSRVRAIGLIDGTEKWSVPLESGTPIHASPVVDFSGRIVVVDVNGHITRLGTSGEVVWTADLDEPVYQTPAAANEMIYFAGTHGGVYAVDAETGSLVWRDTSAGDARSGSAVRRTAPAVDETMVVVAGTNGVVNAYDAQSGHERWASGAGAPVEAAPLLTKEHVFVATLSGQLMALERATGLIVWTVELRGRVKSAMAARDGDLIVLCEPSHVYRFVSRAM